MDLRPDPSLEREARLAAETVWDSGSGILVGEHLDDATPHLPSVVAAALGSGAGRCISTLTCRGRRPEEFEAEIDALVDIGIHAIHCVTGDHPAARLHLDLWPTFYRDGTELAALVASKGASVSVAESPASPPVELRPERVLAKEHAGADVVILNHAGSPQNLIDFVRRCREVGVTAEFVAPVPVITDRRSAEALDRFPGLELPPGLISEVLSASNPNVAGFSAAVTIGRELMDSGVFSGLNLSGAGADTGLVQRARLMSSLARELAA